MTPTEPAAGPRARPPSSPAWYPPIVGLAAAALLGVLLYGHERPVLRGLGVLVVVAATALFLAWYRRHRGPVQSLRGASPELRQSLRTYALTMGILACVLLAAARTLPHPVAVLMGFLAVWIGVAAYERLRSRAGAQAPTPAG